MHIYVCMYVCIYKRYMPIFQMRIIVSYSYDVFMV